MSHISEINIPDFPHCDRLYYPVGTRFPKGCDQELILFYAKRIKEDLDTLEWRGTLPQPKGTDEQRDLIDLILASDLVLGRVQATSLHVRILCEARKAIAAAYENDDLSGLRAIARHLGAYPRAEQQNAWQAPAFADDLAGEMSRPGPARRRTPQA